MRAALCTPTPPWFAIGNPPVPLGEIPLAAVCRAAAVDRAAHRRRRHPGRRRHFLFCSVACPAQARCRRPILDPGEHAHVIVWNACDLLGVDVAQRVDSLPLTVLLAGAIVGAIHGAFLVRLLPESS